VSAVITLADVRAGWLPEGQRRAPACSAGESLALWAASGLADDTPLETLLAWWTPERAIELARADAGPQCGAVAWVCRALGDVLIGADLRGLDMVGRCLRGVNMIRADITGAIMWNVDMRDVIMIGATMIGADMTDAVMCGATMIGADMTRAVMRGADMQYVDMRGAIMHCTDLRRTNLHHADLRYADLTGAIVDEVVW